MHYCLFAGQRPGRPCLNASSKIEITHIESKQKQLSFYLSKQMNSYTEIRKHIAAYAQRLTSDRVLADEITQQVLIKVHESLDELKNRHKLQSWLRKIVYNTLMDHYRQRKALRLPDSLEMAEGETLDDAGNQAVIGCLRSLLKELPDAYQQVLAAVELGNQSQTEYAKAQNLSLSTVHSRLKRARQQLKKQIQAGCYLRTDTYGGVVEYRPPENFSA
jgi:RNA polymerase sigma-70 factor (ECF subfamily)